MQIEQACIQHSQNKIGEEAAVYIGQKSVVFVHFGMWLTIMDHPKLHVQYPVASSKQGPNHSGSIDQETIIPGKANMFWFFSISKENKIILQNKMFFLPTYPNFF